MIRVYPRDNKVRIVTSNQSPDLFATMLAIFKLNKCTFSKPRKEWSCPIHIYEEFKDKLEELDIIQEEDLEELRRIPPELKVSPIRRIPDWSLMNHMPLVGKPPYEKFQYIDITSGINRNRYAYFLGMGSGKTYIAAAIIAHRKFAWNEVGKIIFLTSSIGVKNIYSELREFIRDIDMSRVLMADKTTKEPFSPDIDIIISNYNTFRLICEHYKKKLKISGKRPASLKKTVLPLEEWSGGKDMMLLLDESHNIADPTTGKGAYVALHAPLFEYRYEFTGTPADKPEKIYNQLRVLDPSLTDGLSHTDWLSKYAFLGTRHSSFAVREWKTDKLEEMNKRVTSGYSITRKTEDIIELPPHYIIPVHLDMSKQHRSIYEAFITEDLNRMGAQSVRNIINRFPYMLLAVDNPYLLEKHFDNFSPSLRRKIESFKTEYLEKWEISKEIVEEHKGKKGILWIEHPRTAEVLAEVFKKYNPIVITGATPDKDRMDMVESFKHKKEHELLIANIKVLNTSINITQATYQIYVERVFDFTPYSQSMKRIYRAGQTETVETFIPLYDGTLDMLRDANLSTKGILIEKLLSKDSLSQEEWKNIFNGNISQ
jgi:SNF2 family DNA or RNA helicase